MQHRIRTNDLYLDNRPPQIRALLLSLGVTDLLPWQVIQLFKYLDPSPNQLDAVEKFFQNVVEIDGDEWAWDPRAADVGGQVWRRFHRHVEDPTQGYLNAVIWAELRPTPVQDRLNLTAAAAVLNRGGSSAELWDALWEGNPPIPMDHPNAPSFAYIPKF